MKNLENFVFENRTKKDIKNDPNPEDVVGLSADENGTEGAWAIDEPTDDDLQRKFDKATITKNEKQIYKRMKAEQPFFVQGEAGWGKTSIIVDMAKHFNRSVVTVYLDKALKEDLEGSIVTLPSKNGAVKSVNALPGWAAYMWEHPEKQFLLFFDEMNQADPGVMNALMPIVKETKIAGKKFKNFIVGAAGNFEHENESGINELSVPLRQRFGGIIKWSSRTDEDWKSAFKWMKKKWEGKISEDFIKLFEDAFHLFDSPRNINDHILTPTYRIVQKGDEDELIDAETFHDDLMRLVKNDDDLTRSDKELIEQLAEQMDTYIHKKGLNDENVNSGSSRTGKDMVPQKTKDIILNGMKNGYISKTENGKNVKYGISKENIFKICGNRCNAEMMKRLIAKYEADGNTWKFETDTEWKNAGYKDPLAD